MDIPTQSSSMSENKELKLDFILKELTLSPQAEEAVPGSSSSVELQDQRLVCVEYPAVVSSVDRMLETLGGERAVSKVSRPSLGHTDVALTSYKCKWGDFKQSYKPSQFTIMPSILDCIQMPSLMTYVKISS